MKESELREAISRYKFYHIIQLTDDIATPGDPRFAPAQELCMKVLQSLDLQGKRVLDIGCRDGLFSFAAERMGAQDVVSIDNDLSKPATEFLIPFFHSNIQMRQMNLYDLKPDTFGRFDVVIFPGVLYHLRYPFWGLKAIRDVLEIGGHLVIETPIWRGESHNAMLFCPTGDDSPYEPSSCTFFNEKGLVDTLESLGFEMQSVECLQSARASKRILHGARRWLCGAADRLRPGGRPPIRRVTRSVFHCRFAGWDRDSALTQYWESTHDYHTRHGA